MNCLLAVLTACLFDPSHVTVRADSTWLVTHRDFYSLDHGRTSYDGPVARVEIVGGGDFTRELRVFYGLGHQSYLTTNRDRGYEYVLAGFEWRPFAR